MERSADAPETTALCPRAMNAEPSPEAYADLRARFSAPIPPREGSDAPMAPALPGGLLYGRVLELGLASRPVGRGPLAVLVNLRGEYDASHGDDDDDPPFDLGPGDRVA